MIINLSGINFQYCGVDEGTWKTFKASGSFGTGYQRLFKGHFDCRIIPPPEY